MSYKDRSVADDNWEPGKGCNCSSELKPDLMVADYDGPEWVSRVVLGTSGLASSLCSLVHVCLESAPWSAAWLHDWGGDRTALS